MGKAFEEKVVHRKSRFDKVFDNVHWEFLWEIMSQMNFGRVWISWIKGLICSAKVLVLGKWAPTDQFDIEKGVRQCVPLSPYLFIMVIEGLIVAINEAKGKNLFRGTKPPNNGPKISNLHYADDALFLDVNFRNLF